METQERLELIRKVQESSKMEFVWYDWDNEPAQIIADCLEPEDFQAAVPVNFYYVYDEAHANSIDDWKYNQAFLKDMFYAHVESIFLREP